MYLNYLRLDYTCTVLMNTSLCMHYIPHVLQFVLSTYSMAKYIKYSITVLVQAHKVWLFLHKNHKMCQLSTFNTSAQFILVLGLVLILYYNLPIWDIYSK